MSTYFGALMRASGLKPAGAPWESPQHAIESRIPDLALQAHPAAKDDSREPPRSQADPSFAARDAHAQPVAAAPARATAIDAPPAQIAAADAARTEASRLDDGSGAGSGSRAERAAQGPSVPRDRAGRETGLLAALQWVRADPELARLDESRDLRVSGIEGETAGPAAAETPSPIAATFAHEEPSTVVRHAHAHALVAPVPPAAQGFPAVLDDRSSRGQETVEVSIGAIHVRVDAAPPRAVVTAPVPAPRPKAPTNADHPRARSGLSRRALRTI